MKSIHLVTAALIAVSTPAFSNEVVKDVKVFDHTKVITKYIPTTTYVCNDIKKPVYANVQKQGDAAGSALLGMILGGLIGADKGSQNRTSKEIVGYEIVEQCKDVVRNQEQNVEVYSHSTIRFFLNGERYVLDFVR